MDSFSDIRAFERVVATGNFSTAALQLGVTAAAISKRIASLETRLGVRLLTRTTRLCRPTSEGETFYRSCRDILDRVAAAEEAVRQSPSEPSGLLRLAAPLSFGRRRLAPLLASFQSRYANVKISMTLSDRTNELSTDEYDVVLRVGLPAEGSVISRRVMSARRAVCASPSYLAAYGTPNMPSDLDRHRCILVLRDGRPIDRWMFRVDGVVESVKVDGLFFSNSGEVVQEWALAGCGIALKSLWDIEPDLAEGRLVELLRNYSEERADIHALYPDKRNLPARVKAFFDFLVETEKGPLDAEGPAPPNGGIVIR